jgi:hypothetical protein
VSGHDGSGFGNVEMWRCGDVEMWRFGNLESGKSGNLNLRLSNFHISKFPNPQRGS